MDADCDAPTDDEAERHETQQAAHCTGSTTEEALPSMLRLGTTLTEGLHVSTLGSASSPNLSSIDAVRATGDDEGGDTPVNDDGVDAVDDESNGTEPAGTTTLVDYAADAEVEDRQGAELGSQRETPTPVPDTAEQQNDTASRVTGWCNGDSVRNDGSMAFVDADTLGQMPHGRWQSSTVLGMSSGISWEAAPAVGTGRGWTARTFTDNNGTNIGMTRFRPTDMVHVGTGEELVLKLTGMMPGTRVERRTSSSGVTSHLARSSRRIDMSPVLASVGLNVTNTNAMAHHMLQSFITNTTTLCDHAHASRREQRNSHTAQGLERSAGPPADPVATRMLGRDLCECNTVGLSLAGCRSLRTKQGLLIEVGEGGDGSGRRGRDAEAMVARGAINAGFGSYQRPSPA